MAAAAEQGRRRAMQGGEGEAVRAWRVFLEGTDAGLQRSMRGRVKP